MLERTCAQFCVKQSEFRTGFLAFQSRLHKSEESEGSSHSGRVFWFKNLRLLGGSRRIPYCLKYDWSITFKASVCVCVCVVQQIWRNLIRRTLVTPQQPSRWESEERPQLFYICLISLRAQIPGSLAFLSYRCWIIDYLSAPSLSCNSFD